MTKIYFGRLPDGSYVSLDARLIIYLEQSNYNFNNAVELLSLDLLPEVVYHTLNPLIPNYMEEKLACKLFWIIDTEGNHIHVKQDSSFQCKIKFMGVGEALCDDARSWEG